MPNNYPAQSSQVFTRDSLVEVELVDYDDPRRGRIAVIDSYGVTLKTKTSSMTEVTEKHTLYPWSAIVAVSKVAL